MKFLNDEQIKLCNDLDSEGLRAAVESLMQRITITSQDTTRYVDDPMNGFFQPLKRTVAGVMRYGQDQESVRIVATTSGYPLLPNGRYRATMKTPSFLIQIRRIKSLAQPPTITKSHGQLQLMLTYASARRVIFIGAYFLLGDRSFHDTFISPHRIVIAELDNSLSGFCVAPFDAQSYLNGEHLLLRTVEERPKKKAKKPDVGSFIKKDLQHKKERRQRRSNE